METALAVRDDDEPHWIYKVTEKHTGRVVYVGKTKNIKGRWKQHLAGTSGAERFIEAIKAHGYGWYRIDLVMEFSVPKSVVDQYEAHFIYELDTLFHPKTCKHGLNTNPGGHSLRLDPRLATTGTARAPPAERLRGMAAMHETMAELVAQAGEDAAATTLHEEAERYAIRAVEAKKSLWEFVREARDGYGKLPPHEPVTRDGVVGTLGSILSKSAEVGDGKMDEELKTMIKGQKRWLNSDHFKGEISAGFARDVVSCVYQALVHSEEAKLKERVELHKKLDEDTVDDEDLEAKIVGLYHQNPSTLNSKIVARAKATLSVEVTDINRGTEGRMWSVAHGWKKPAGSAAKRDPDKKTTATPAELAEEARIGQGLDSWKNQDKRRNESIIRLLLRDMPWVDAFLDSGEADKKAYELANRALLNGYGATGDPCRTCGPVQAIPGASAKERDQVTWMLCRLVAGNVKQCLLDVLFDGVDADRKQWYMDAYEAAKPERKAKVKATTKRQAENRAETMAAAKKAKQEEAAEEETGSPSTEHVEDSDSDSN